MQAETAYNVFQSLSEKEKVRFYKMCGVKVKVENEAKPAKKPLLTDAEATEYLIAQLNKSKQKRARQAQ